jgi:hypothetical protein
MLRTSLHGRFEHGFVGKLSKYWRSRQSQNATPTTTRQPLLTSANIATARHAFSSETAEFVRNEDKVRRIRITVMRSCLRTDAGCIR